MSDAIVPEAADPTTWSARRLTRALREREISATEALDAHLARIETINLALNAVVVLDVEGARRRAGEADELAARVEDPAQLPPLHGLPMTHKDTHLVAGIRSTSGSAVADHVPTADDLVVARLRAAGANSTGKNNVPEFAAGSHTFNELFGATGNAFDPGLSAGGSSGGAAVAVATRMQALADGSDMGGSLRNPAAFNGVVGFRPSVGVVPVAPTRNAWAWLSRTGPIARDVADIALAMTVLAGPDPAVAYPCPVSGAEFAPLLRGAGDPGSAPLAGVRVGLTLDFGLGVPVEPEIRALVRAQADVLSDLGAHVEESCPSLRLADEVFDVTRAFDMALSLRELVARHGEAVKADIHWNVERGLALSAGDLMDAAVARTRLRSRVDAWFETHDALLAPTTQVMPFPTQLRYPEQVDGVPMTSYVDWMRSCTLVSAMGGPAVSMPGGFVGGLPVGVQFVGPHGGDVRLLRTAQAYERATGHAAVLPPLLGH
ncbi:amidase [Agilicoccus flavus]|uniref:amidase n=1 Tax=Agilicoccus flavus TaxID=2775968 RepID=UPI001CF655C1|nr:amidase family protein [Agilicoccus flavus]